MKKKKNRGTTINISFCSRVWPVFKLEHWQENYKWFTIYIWPFRFSFSRSTFEDNVKWYQNNQFRNVAFYP